MQNQTENLRRQSVADVFAGLNIGSDIEARRYGNELNSAQAESLREATGFNRSTQDLRREKLIADIAQTGATTKNIQSEFRARDTLLDPQRENIIANTYHTRAQADTVVASRQPLIEKMRADIRVAESVYGVNSAQADEIRRTTQPKIDKLEADIRHVNQQVTESNALLGPRVIEILSRTDYTQTQAEESRQLLGAKKVELEERIKLVRSQIGKTDAEKETEIRMLQPRLDEVKKRLEQADALIRHYNADSSRTEQLTPEQVRKTRLEGDAYTTYTLPDGKTVTMTGHELADLLRRQDDDKRAREKEAQGLRVKAADLARQARQDRAKEAASVAEAEQLILNNRKTNEPDKIRAAAAVTNVFNEFSNAPYVYVPAMVDYTFPQRNWPDNIRVDLKPIQGVQLRARDIYKRADEKGMTVGQYMETVYFPLIKEKPPWLRLGH